MSTYMDVPEYCDCGSVEFYYEVNKRIDIEVDEWGEPCISGASDSFSDVKCSHCEKAWVSTEDVREDGEIDIMLDA